jgi:hypothetical protein
MSEYKINNYRWFHDAVSEIDDIYESDCYFVCYFDDDNKKYKPCSSIYNNIIEKLYNTNDNITVYICDCKISGYEPIEGITAVITKPPIVKTLMTPIVPIAPTPKKQSFNTSPPPLLPKNKYGSSSIYDNTLSQRYDWDLLSRSNLGSLIGYNQNNNFNNDIYGFSTSQESIQRQNEERAKKQNDERIEKQNEEILQRQRREIIQTHNQQKQKSERININDYDDVVNAFENDPRFKDHPLNRSNPYNQFNRFNQFN